MSLTEKQKRKNIYKRIWACNELMKRYGVTLPSNISSYEKNGETVYYNKRLAWDVDQQFDMMNECIQVLISEDAKSWRKRAAKQILTYIVGIERANEMLEGIAIVEDRDDSLVYRWRKKVVERDGRCVECGNVENLHAHHISHWSDDPINRINVDNGVALCSECHAEEHPELEKLIKSKAVM